MTPFTPLKVGEFCQRVGIAERDVKYAFEQGFFPPGLDDAPGRGEHRQLTLDQCVWLAVLLKLKDAGVRLPAAKTASDHTNAWSRSRLLTVRAPASPMADENGEVQVASGPRVAIEVGDSTHVRAIYRYRLDGRGEELARPWSDLSNHPAGDFSPVVTIRVDLARLVGMLCG